MAKKLSPPPTQSPPSSSSSEEGSSSEGKQINDTKPDPQKTLSKKPESESESESEFEILRKEAKEEDADADADDRFEVVALNGDSNKGKSLKREFPFIRDALSGNRLALERLKSIDVEKVAVLEKKLKKLKFEEINLIRKAYKLVCK